MWIYAILPVSTTNGPGRRAVVWLSGCDLYCVGCWNPSVQVFCTGASYSPEALFERIRAVDDIEGVTISGGEPLLQDAELVQFLRLIRSRTSLSVVVFSGLTLIEIRRRLKRNKTEELLTLIDLLKTGRYVAGQPTKAPLRGSRNQRLHFLTPRYTRRDLGPKAFEIFIEPNGQTILTGFPPKANLNT